MNYIRILLKKSHIEQGLSIESQTFRKKYAKRGFTVRFKSKVAKPRVIVIGGGYAGLAAVLYLSKTAAFDVLLIDRNESFLELTQLHKTVHSSLSVLQTPYSSLAKTIGFRYLRKDLPVDGAALRVWQAQGAIASSKELFPFDYLIICTGACAHPLEAGSPGAAVGKQLLNLEHLKQSGLQTYLQTFLKQNAPEQRVLSIVGGGASGVQFLFELDDYLRTKREQCLLNFIHAEDRLLTGFPESFHEHVRSLLRSRNGTIEYLPATRFIAQSDESIMLASMTGDKRFTRASHLTLLFPGVSPQPLGCETDPQGRVFFHGEASPNIFAAGDCSIYAGSGLNALTAQAAVRKAKLVAANVECLAKGRALHNYDYQALGYFVGLGTWDGIGWLLAESNTLAGLPAFAIKSAVEKQFSLLLTGIDAY